MTIYPSLDAAAAQWKQISTDLDAAFADGKSTQAVTDQPLIAAADAAGYARGLAACPPAPVPSILPFAASSLFYQPLSSPKVDPNSDLICQTFQGKFPATNTHAWECGGVSNTYGVPLYVATGAEPKVTISPDATYPNYWTDLAPGPLVIPFGTNWQPSGAPDSHLAVNWQGYSYEFWKLAALTGTTWKAAVATRFPLSGTGYRLSAKEGTTARAWGGSNKLGLITFDDVLKGSIDHALVCALVTTRHGRYVAPATMAGGAVGDAADRADYAPCGMRFYLDLTKAQVDALKLPAFATMVAKALCREGYGAYVVDGAGSNELFFEMPTRGRTWGALGVTFDSLYGLPRTGYKACLMGALQP